MNKKIALNTLFITGASFFSKAIAYFYFILLTRSFAQDKIGIFGVLITSLIFMELFSGLGFDKILMRELSKGKDYYFFPAVFFRFFSSFVVFILFLFLFLFFYKDLMQIYFKEIFIFLLTIFFISFYKNIEDYYVAKEKMLFNAIGQIIEKIGIFVSSTLVFYKVAEFKTFLYLFFIAELITFFYYLIIFLTKENIKINFKIDLTKIQFFIKESISMFIVEIIAIIYFRVDIFMLSKMTDMRITGLYLVSYKIFDFFITFFSGFLLAVFPYFSRQGKDIQIFKIVFSGIILLIPFILAGIYFRQDILIVFNKSYEKASVSLFILLLTVPFVFANSLLVNYFIANGLQKFIIKFGIILIVSNIVLNFIFIPYFSLNGAALTTFLCEILLTGMFIYFYFLSRKEMLKI